MKKGYFVKILKPTQILDNSLVLPKQYFSSKYRLSLMLGLSLTLKVTVQGTT